MCIQYVMISALSSLYHNSFNYVVYSRRMYNFLNKEWNSTVGSTKCSVYLPDHHAHSGKGGVALFCSFLGPITSVSHVTIKHKSCDHQQQGTLLQNISGLQRDARPPFAWLVVGGGLGMRLVSSAVF